MILLHNPSVKESREFLAHYREHFTEVLRYPVCLNQYPAVAKYPAVVVDIPEWKRDNTLYYLIKSRYIDYRRRGRLVADILDCHTKELEDNLSGTKKTWCDSSLAMSGSDLYTKKYCEAKGWPREKLLFLVEIANEGDIPGYLLAWGLLNDDRTYDTGVDYAEDLSDASKSMYISYLDHERKVKVIPACQEILYPETIEEVYARLAEAARLKAILEE